MWISAQNVSTIYKTGRQQGCIVYHKHLEIYCIPQIMEKNLKNFLRKYTHTHTHTHTHIYIIAVFLLLSCVFCNSMGCSLPGFSVQGISQAKILEWLAISFSRRSSLPRDWARIFCLAGRFFSTEPLGKPYISSLCCTVEANTMLQINYTPVKLVFLSEVARNSKDIYCL